MGVQSVSVLPRKSLLPVAAMEVTCTNGSRFDEGFTQLFPISVDMKMFSVLDAIKIVPLVQRASTSGVI